MDIGSYVSQLGMLAGVGALIGVIVNALKLANIVKDGQAATWSTGLNIAALVGLFALKVFAPSANVTELDATAASIANAASTVLALIVQLYGAKWAHGALKSVPVIGKSYS